MPALIAPTAASAPVPGVPGGSGIPPATAPATPKRADRFRCRCCPPQPFTTVMDDQIVMSSLPFASDIPALKDLRVGAVVNMCREWPGPTQAYKDAGLRQLQLATQDTCAPSVDSLEAHC